MSFFERKSSEYYEIFSLYKKWKIEKGEELLTLYFSNNRINVKEKEELSRFFNNRKKQKEELSLFENKIREEIDEGDIKKLKNSISPSLRNKIILSYLEEEQIKGAKAYFGKRKFDDNKLEMLMIVSYLENSFYIDLKLNYRNGKWLIESFDERR